MKWFKPKRKVFLLMGSGDMVVRDAVKTQSGWCARWIDTERSWSLLKPDGTTQGTYLVKGWFPHTGWPSDEVKE